jgi:hypothetical protein
MFQSSATLRNAADNINFLRIQTSLSPLCYVSRATAAAPFFHLTPLDSHGAYQARDYEGNHKYSGKYHMADDEWKPNTPVEGQKN